MLCESLSRLLLCCAQCPRSSLSLSLLPKYFGAFGAQKSSGQHSTAQLDTTGPGPLRGPTKGLIGRFFSGVCLRIPFYLCELYVVFI